MIGSVAWLEGLLRERLGPDAALGTLTFEGRLLRIERARLPVGRGAVLRVAHATIELGAGAPLGALPLSARLLALRGELHALGLAVPLDFAAGAGGETSWANGTRSLGAPVDLALAGTAKPGGETSWAHGTLRLGAPLDLVLAGTVKPGEGGGFAFDLATARGARVRGRGRLPFAPSSREDAVAPLLALQLDRADAALLAAVALPLEGRRSPRIPPDLTLTGDLVVGAGRAVSGSFALETPRSALVVHLSAGAAGELVGSTLRGRLGATDAITAGLFPGRVRPQPGDVFGLDARLTGTLARPGVAGRVTAARVSLDTGAGTVVLEHASALLDVDADRLAWHGLAGRLHGGTFSSSGHVTLARGTGALSAGLSWSGVRVEALPTRASGEGPLAKLLHGASSGELSFERAGLHEHALSARGRVTVDEPVYPFARSFAPALARYGLPAIRSRGRGPLAAAVRLERGEILVEPFSAALDGVDVDGTLRLGEGGRLLGRVRIHLRARYLAGSPILAIPAALAGTVTIPIHLGGTLSAPDVQTDALEILDGLLSTSKVGDAVKSVLDGFWNTNAPRRGATPRKRR